MTTSGGTAVALTDWPYGAASSAAGWVNWYTYVYGSASVDDPSATDYVVTVP